MRRKKDKTLLKGNHAADRMTAIVPIMPTSTAKPPRSLRPEARKWWKKLHPLLTHCGVLKETDEQIFTDYCVMAGLCRELAGELRKGLFLESGEVHPVARDYRLALQTLLKLGNELGLSPKARQSVNLTKSEQITSNPKLSRLLDLDDWKTKQEPDKPENPGA